MVDLSRDRVRLSTQGLTLDWVVFTVAPFNASSSLVIHHSLVQGSLDFGEMAS